MIVDFSGRCFKIAFGDELDILLRTGDPDRPPARFNRRGQDALYLSATEEGARTAVRKYPEVPGRPRVIVEYAVGSLENGDRRTSPGLPASPDRPALPG